ncbi:ABC transporter permease [Actinomadura rudentiformis]|uniref:FtsX-like permease family protein n=1 Tax=Actinomadura rudentiformis TaxID=359158 RepID=A0A6H9Z211_9ACTN|nr:FtsX-like permease family protein [Actinomadura rudentiformis]KAB2350813.1 FtsX-like permease family protein [Actinomadura rudentiformis]
MLKTTLAGLRAHKLRLLLTGLAITLGVGFIAGTFVLTDTMEKGVDKKFAKSADKVDVAVLPKGSSGPSDSTEGQLPAALLEKIRALPGVTEAQGAVRGDAPLVGKDGKVVGDMPTVGLSVPGGRLQRYELDKGRVPAGPNEAVVDTKTAEREGFTVGQAITVLDGKRTPHRFTLVGIADFGIDPDAGYRGAVGFDPATATRMTGSTTYEEIDVAGGGLDAVTRAAGGSYDVVTGAQLGDRLAKSAGADMKVIRNGLLIFGLVSLVVSALVIYNTFSILIAQRMREMALLRCVGATRRQIFGSVLTESAVVGFVGSLTGLIAGLGLGGGALALFNALGAGIPTAAVTLAPRTIVVGLLVGVVVTVVSALLPARAATRIAPIAALRTDLEPGSGRFRLGWPRTVLSALLGLGGLGLGVFGALVMAKGQAAMFTVAVSGGLVFLAVITLMPALVRPLGRLAGAIPARLGGVPGRLAVENARRSPRRTATTTIALTIGVGLMSLFAVVAASGKATTDAQLDKQFPVDYQLTTQFSGGDAGDEPVPRALTAVLRNVPQVASVTELRTKETLVGGTEERVGSVTPSSLGTVLKPEFATGSLADLRPGTVAVDQETAKGRGLRAGQTVQVKTRQGNVPLKVIGTFGTDAPVTPFLVTEADFNRYFAARDPEMIFVNAKEGAASKGARTAVENAAQPYPTVKVISSAELREQFSKAIDMVLMIFGGLLGLAIIIALFGIANTLTLSVVERTRESALLRALGITKRQLRRMLSVEAFVMAVMGAFTGVVLGVAFGWAATTAMAASAVFALPWLQVIGFMVLAGLAGMVAAVLPARRAAKASIVESLAHD